MGRIVCFSLCSFFQGVELEGLPIAMQTQLYPEKGVYYLWDPHFTSFYGRPEFHAGISPEKNTTNTSTEVEEPYKYRLSHSYSSKVL